MSKKYKNCDEKLLWQCEKGHQWEASYYSIQNGTWCPMCCYRKAEQKVREAFEEIFNVEFPTKKPEWLVNEENNRLELDGYSEKLGIAFEYQGEQHFGTFHNNFFGGKKALKKRLKHDKLKVKLCKKNDVQLVVIPYWIEDYEEYILSETEKEGCS